MSLSDKEIFEFDSFRLDPAERLLLCESEPVPLEPKVFETLLVLIRNSGRLVTKEELMQAVWPDTFVEESNLVRNVSLLRKALNRGDSAQRYIESVPKWGYRFVAEVRPAAGDRTDLILETEKVTVVIEEEGESDDGSGSPREEATRRVSAIMKELEQGVAIEGKQNSFGRLKKQKVSVVLTLVLLLAAVATAVYVFVGNRQTIDSIAVLPFINADADPSTEYLSDGITDSLINSLSQLPKLKVMSRNSVFRYKGNGTDAQQAGKALGVRAVLTGKTIKRGDDLIISAELVDVRDNSHLWGERYDRKLSDLLAVQKELARGITQRLRLEFSNEAQQRLAGRDPQNPEAYELYLKGRYALNNLTRQQQSGLGYFQQAIEKDPNYSLAYAGMAEAYVLMADIGATFRLPPREAFTLAKAAALKAVEGDDARAEAYVSLGRIAFNYEWNWAETEVEFKRAIALKPDFVPAHHWYSHLLISQGRFDESLAESLRALALDPLDVAMNFHLGFHYWTARQYDQASAQLEKTLGMNPNHFETHGILGLVYAQQERYPEAIAHLRKFRELGGWDNRGFLGYVYAVSGQRDEAQKILAELHEEARSKVVSKDNIARVYAGLGEKEQAFAWLEKAIAERDSNLTMPGLKVDPTFESLHPDSRFTGLLQQVGVTP